MDFLKRLSIHDDESKPAAADSAAHPSPPAPAPATTDHHHGLLDKLSSALHHTDQHPTPTPPAPAPAPAPAQPVAPHKSDESVFSKIGDALTGHGHGHGHDSKPASAPPPPPPAPAKEEYAFLDKILGGHHDTPAPAPAPVAAKEKEKEKEKEGLFDIIGNALGGVVHHHHHDAPPAPPPVKKEEHGLLGKIGEVVGHGKHEEPKKPETLGDKINNVLGGGSKGEAKEDKLDKAIDLVQEHILKEGQQKDESAVEQLKDKEIAGAIRTGFKNVTGHELPSHDKKHDE